MDLSLTVLDTAPVRRITREWFHFTACGGRLSPNIDQRRKPSDQSSPGQNESPELAVEGQTPNILCVIPARGGSRRVPGKNIADICGKPTLAYTCEHLNAMRFPHDSLVVTDDPEIEAVARVCGLPVSVEKPEWERSEFELVAVHEATSEIEIRDRKGIDIVVVAYACCPVRPPGIFDRAIDELVAFNADAVQSMSRVPGRFHPRRTFQMLRGGELNRIVSHDTELDRSAEVRPAFAISAAALVFSRRALELARYSGVQRLQRFRAILHDEDESIDIDTPHDLARARAVIEKMSG